MAAADNHKSLADGEHPAKKPKLAPPSIIRGADVIPRSELSLMPESKYAVYVGDNPKQMKAPGPGGCYAKDASGNVFKMEPGTTVAVCRQRVTEIYDWKSGTYPKKAREDLVRVHYCYKRTPPPDGAECSCGVCGTYEWADSEPCDCDEADDYCHNDKCAVM